MISHDYRLFFIHIPKCAGRSVIAIFNQRADHLTANYYAQWYKDRWKEYDKFALVRNPYERLVSIYHYIQQHRRQAQEPIACKGVPFKQWVIENFTAFKGPFDKNSAEGEWGTDYQAGSPFWFSPQYRFIGDGELGGIDVLRMEDGMNKVEEYISKVTAIRDPKIGYTNFSKHGIWEMYYDEELFTFLRTLDFIKEDCHQFNYELK